MYEVMWEIMVELHRSQIEIQYGAFPLNAG
jgi:hypothetical protein